MRCFSRAPSAGTQPLPGARLSCRICDVWQWGVREIFFKFYYDCYNYYSIRRPKARRELHLFPGPGRRLWVRAVCVPLAVGSSAPAPAGADFVPSRPGAVRSRGRDRDRGAARRAVPESRSQSDGLRGARRVWAGRRSARRASLPPCPALSFSPRVPPALLPPFVPSFPPLFPAPPSGGRRMLAGLEVREEEEEEENFPGRGGDSGAGTPRRGMDGAAAEPPPREGGGPEGGGSRERPLFSPSAAFEPGFSQQPQPEVRPGLGTTREGGKGGREGEKERGSRAPPPPYPPPPTPPPHGSPTSAAPLPAPTLCLSPLSFSFTFACPATF